MLNIWVHEYSVFFHSFRTSFISSSKLYRVFLYTNGSEVKASAHNAGGLGSSPGSGRSPGEGNGNPLQYFRLENPMDGEAWWATAHRVAKSRTRLSDFTFTLWGFCSYLHCGKTECFPWTISRKNHRDRLWVRACDDGREPGNLCRAQTSVLCSCPAI